MTNAEKLARNTTEIACLIVYPEDTNECRYCVYRHETCSVNCEKGVKAWLEQEAEEDNTTTEKTASDGQEVKCGLWLPTINGGFECSVCHSVWKRKFLHDPHCGAKMDEV